MDYMDTATPERPMAARRRPLRGWIGKRAVPVRPVAAPARIGFDPTPRADDAAPFDGDDLLRRLREAGL